jgi:hypothetical protein
MYADVGIVFATLTVRILRLTDLSFLFSLVFREDCGSEESWLRMSDISGAITVT